jgi:hypothetical protein
MTNAPLWLGVVFHLALGWMILAVAKPLSVALASVDLWRLLSGGLGAVPLPWIRRGQLLDGLKDADRASQDDVRAGLMVRRYPGPPKHDLTM